MAERINWSDWFYYDESSKSHLRRKTDWCCGPNGSALREPAGSEAGTIHIEGYYNVQVHGRIFKAHRVIYELFNGEIEDGMQIDHVDGNPSNNRRTNLRCVEGKVNSRNKKKRINNSSGETGVSFHANLGGNTYWKAVWNDVLCNHRSRYFSICKLGNDEAFRLACEWREKMITELNEQGAGYTNSHGKR